MIRSMMFLAAAVLAAPVLAAPPAAPAAAAQAAAATVKVNGLVCDFCVQALTRTFNRQAAVARVHVDLDAKEIHLGFRPGQTLPDAVIRELVTKSGYNVVGIARG